MGNSLGNTLSHFLLTFPSFLFSVSSLLNIKTFLLAFLLISSVLHPAIMNNRCCQHSGKSREK